MFFNSSPAAACITVLLNSSPITAQFLGTFIGNSSSYTPVLTKIVELLLVVTNFNTFPATVVDSSLRAAKFAFM